jgi:hypothetical protein
MNNRGFVKTLLIIVLLLLVMLLYYQTDETKEIVGMLISDIDTINVDTGEITDIVEKTLDETSGEITEEVTEGVTEEIVEEVIDEVKEKATLVNASEMAHLLIETSSTSSKEIIEKLNAPEANDTDEDNSDEDDDE